MKHETVWTTREGEPLTMREIADGHLGNIIRMLRRRRDDALEESMCALGCVSGEIAEYHITSTADSHLSYLSEKIAMFEAEAARRGVKINDE